MLLSMLLNLLDMFCSLHPTQKLVASTMYKTLAFMLLLALPMIVVHCDDSHSYNSVLYTQENFEENIKAKKHFVMFFAPWCGHCKRLAPTWEDLAKLYNTEDSDVTIAKVDCTVDTKVCVDQQVRGYPTVKFFNMELNNKVVLYRGNRDLDSLQKFVMDELAKEEDKKEEEEEDEKPEEDIKKLVELDSANFEKVTERGDHFIKFYAPWCGHCQRLAPTWQELATSAHIDGLMIEKVDCTAHRVVCDKFGVQVFPTLFWFRDGQKIDQYRGGRSLEELKNYATEMMEKKTGSPKEGNDAEVVPGKVIEEDLEEVNTDKDKPNETVLSLNKANFDETVSEDLTFIEFFAPWCGHCIKLAPTWDELGKKYADVEEIKIAKVDCTQERDLCSKYEVTGYPTLLLFHNGVKKEDYLEGRDLDALSRFVERYFEVMEEDTMELEHDEL
ncbi:hypothetical protein CHS0354_012748 [Potamilus streckersoni]|uniref:Thioredoxin domain-containing protein n=1 Tax=Potamilus streckersoni TaxID=2493646 RepID=A0AAE0RV87_9BIVA|nr:hypothetical protein CHS0354_012748 [Potamilus streckersoni]